MLFSSVQTDLLAEIHKFETKLCNFLFNDLMIRVYYHDFDIKYTYKVLPVICRVELGLNFDPGL